MDKAEAIENVFTDLQQSLNLSLDITAAGEGDTAALERLSEPQTVEMSFPGSKERAMGHALTIIEDLDEVGVSAERQHRGEVEDAVLMEDTSIHRIDIVIEGGGESDE